MWNNQVGVLEMILEFFHVHFPDAQLGTDRFKSCLLEVLASYETCKGEYSRVKNGEKSDITAAPETEQVEGIDLSITSKTSQKAEQQDQQDEKTAIEDPAETKDEDKVMAPLALTTTGVAEEASDYFPCAFCGEVFPTHSAYESHASSHHVHEAHNRSHHECDVCGRCFDSYMSFKRHRINHSLVKPFTCDLCTRAFTRNHDLQRHKANVHRVRSYLVSDAVRVLNRHSLPSCRRCKRSFTSRSQLEEHLQSRKCVLKESGGGNGVVGGSGPFFCERCGMTFEQSGHLAEHRTSLCRGGPPLPPPNVTFPSESIGPLSFASDCLFKFGKQEEATPDTDKWKMEVVESSDAEQDLACEHCSATFRLETDLVEHRILEHTPLPGTKRQHSSDGSPEVSLDGTEEPMSKQMLTAFPTSQGDADDEREDDDENEDEEDDDDDEDDDEEEEEEDENSNEATDLSLGRNDPCASTSSARPLSQTGDEVGKMTDFDSGASETGIDVWVCVYCSHSFCNKATLDRHMRTHTGEKPFQCPVCVKRFTRKHDLERHRSNIHEGVRPFNCPYCPKNFPLKKNLAKHLLMTHRIREAGSSSPLSSGPVDVSM